MENNFEVLKKIFIENGFPPLVSDVYIGKLKSALEESSMKNITPQFIYTKLAYDLGRTSAESIAEYYGDYLKSGEYLPKVQRIIKDKPWMK